MGRKAHTLWINQAQVDAGRMNNWRMRRSLAEDLDEGSWQRVFYEGVPRMVLVKEEFPKGWSRWISL